MKICAFFFTRQQNLLKCCGTTLHGSPFQLTTKVKSLKELNSRNAIRIFKKIIIKIYTVTLDHNVKIEQRKKTIMQSLMQTFHYIIPHFAKKKNIHLYF